VKFNHLTPEELRSCAGTGTKTRSGLRQYAPDSHTCILLPTLPTAHSLHVFVGNVELTQRAFLASVRERAAPGQVTQCTCTCGLHLRLRCCVGPLLPDCVLHAKRSEPQLFRVSAHCACRLLVVTRVPLACVHVVAHSPVCPQHMLRCSHAPACLLTAWVS
jgi:hypothetical protein